MPSPGTNVTANADPTNNPTLEQPETAVQDGLAPNRWEQGSLSASPSAPPRRPRTNLKSGGDKQGGGTKKITTQSGSPPRKKTKGKTSGKKWKKKYSLMK